MLSAMERLRNGVNAHDSYARGADWDEIVNAVHFEGDDPESENLDACVANDVMSLIAAECARPELDDYVLNSMTTVATMVGLSSRNAVVYSSNIDMIKGYLRVAREKIPSSVGAYALTGLTNMALNPVTHKNLLSAGSLDFAISLLGYLDGTSDNEIDVGLTSASFICRVVGKEESGPGPDAIKANTKLVEKLLWILTSVLDAGPNGRVIGYHWDPANILSDVATLATSDRNKPLLVDFIEQLLKALELRPDNRRACRFAIVALSQLSFEPRCKPKFTEFKERMTKALDLVIDTFPETEKQAKLDAQVLKATINETELPAGAQTTKTGMRRGSALRRAVKGMMGASAKPVNAPQGHVLISYQWDTQPLAVELEKRLTAAGVKTWFDLNDMGSNINDSMAFAVENALAIIVLFCRKYKESGNCRKECEMGDNLQKPMIFVKVEKDYKQEAWLSLVMGKSLYIDCPNLEDLDRVFPQIAKRVSTVTSTPIKALPSVAATTKVEAPAKPLSDGANGGSGDIKGMLLSIMSQMKEMKTELTVMKTGIAELKAEVKVIASKRG